jgi:hypothetical protein
MLLLLAMSCSTPETPEPSMTEQEVPQASPERVVAEATALAKATDAVGDVKTTFGTRLHEAIGTEGLEGAARVCSEEAQGMTALLSAESGAKVGRSSTKLRNPQNAGPDWVQEYLAEQDGKLAVDVPGLSEIEGDTARVAKPIGIQSTCLSCHGTEVDPSVKSMLEERYPEDKAVGYREGELRGVIWAEVPVAL